MEIIYPHPNCQKPHIPKTPAKPASAESQLEPNPRLALQGSASRGSRPTVVHATEEASRGNQGPYGDMVPPSHPTVRQGRSYVKAHKECAVLQPQRRRSERGEGGIEHHNNNQEAWKQNG